MFSSPKPSAIRGIQDEIGKLASTLAAGAAGGRGGDISDRLKALELSCEELKRSASGSWLGYHAFVYYNGLQAAPPGANFSQEFGLEDLSFTSLGSVGDWRQFDPRTVRDHILQMASVESIEPLEIEGSKARRTFEAVRSEMFSIFEVMPKGTKDTYVGNIFEDLKALKSPSPSEIITAWRPRGQIMTRDMIAMGQGSKAPPHLIVLSEIISIRLAFSACEMASEILQKISSHLRRKGDMSNETTSDRIFIGHGRSTAWRELKDFLHDRLHVAWNEFNRIPAAGVPTTVRLGELLSDSTFALLVLTAEDETAEGEMQARMNVVHEVGLFQGRLGFSRAIVLLEDGCAEFTNIAGLGQIRFPKGNIAAVFEDVRRVLEREEVIS